MAPADVQKTAIITPFGLFESLFMPFGLMNAAQTFQRLMDRLFRKLPFVFTYLVDHLVASPTLEEHMDHLSQFFQVLEDNGLVINPGKCNFASTSVKFLATWHPSSADPCQGHSGISAYIHGQTAATIPRHDKLLQKISAEDCCNAAAADRPPSWQPQSP
jgi:hypothetical protein